MMVPVKSWFCDADMVTSFVNVTPVASKVKLGKFNTTAEAMLEPSCTLSVLVPEPPSRITAVITSGDNAADVETDKISFAEVPVNAVALVAKYD